MYLRNKLLFKIKTLPMEQKEDTRDTRLLFRAFLKPHQ